MTKSNKHVAVYLRTSTSGQNIESQRAELQRWLDVRDIAWTSVWCWLTCAPANIAGMNDGDDLDRYRFPRRDRGREAAVGIVGGLFCCGSVYALVALPLGVGASATLESNEPE